MKRQLFPNKCLLLLLVTFLIGFAGTKTTMAQTSGYPHAFLVSDSMQVYFSPGNLQYKASTNTWRFAINPWDCIGDANNNISSTYDGWIEGSIGGKRRVEPPFPVCEARMTLRSMKMLKDTSFQTAFVTTRGKPASVPPKGTTS